MKPETHIKKPITYNNGQTPKNMYQNDIKKTAVRSVPLTHRPVRSMDISRSNTVKHFTPKLINTVDKKINQAVSDIRHIKHPLTKIVEQRRQSTIVAPKTNQPMSLKEIKEQTINEAIKKPVAKDSKPNFFKKHLKFINIFSISLAALLVIACVLYLFMPNISVKIASAQAKISATFPEYRPDGYRVNGPVIFSNGEVVINFKSNTNDSKFAIKQSKSSWDSSAVRNRVNKDSGGEFITTEEKGLTIYTYNGNAAWVNRGILYSIEGNAALSGDQIRRIATSL
jgi:hypothetical protein